jgi:hypothetical protein
MRELFGKVDNLNMFVHPKFNESFRFMDETQSINLAKEILKRFEKSGIENIVVIESGTSPLIAIMKKLKEYQNCKFKIIQIKIPRDLNFNLLEWFNAYLSENEKNEEIEFEGKILPRYEALAKLCSKFNLEKFVGNDKFTIYDSIKNVRDYDDSTEEFYLVLAGTKLYEIFNKQFLLFDEYINAGTIIRNFNGIVRLFSKAPNFKLSAFCMFLDNPEKYKNIEFTLYDNSCELQCYRNGAYPFENRIDLIGYYYFITRKEFKKVYLGELYKDLEDYKDLTEIEKFYKKLNEIIDENSLLDTLKINISEEQVRKYVSNKDIIRYILKYIDKKIYGENKFADFLDQVFELYAPSWSPMPVIYHLDYWSGFEKITNEIDKVISQIKKDYIKNRFNIINLALECLEENNQKWVRSIDQKLESKA